MKKNNEKYTSAKDVLSQTKEDRGNVSPEVGSILSLKHFDASLIFGHKILSCTEFLIKIQWFFWWEYSDYKDSGWAYAMIG